LPSWQYGRCEKSSSSGLGEARWAKGRKRASKETLGIEAQGNCGASGSGSMVQEAEENVRKMLPLLERSSILLRMKCRKSDMGLQFNKDLLPQALKKAGLKYVHLAGLGGLRHANRDSVNMAWRNASFRGFADYMQTPEFKQSLEELIQLANEERIALMCAEAVPW
jgi:hypothetical protein